uniref:Uncharacterized protein n=1 Tax=Romanomermis culicivorax TaxID=13658 RepID=A0A915K691_ROMCU
MMCVYFKGMQFDDGKLVFPVEIILVKCKDAFKKSGSPSVPECMAALDEMEYCYVREYRIGFGINCIQSYLFVSKLLHR